MEKTECGSVWEYYLFETFIRHKCRLPNGHAGRHEGFAAEWSREAARLVPSEHPPICISCGHSLDDNNHGFDQNDGYLDGDKLVHSGSCTYCRDCNPILAAALDRHAEQRYKDRLPL